MDAPYTSGTESLAPQTVVEIGDCLLCQVREGYIPNAGEDVAVNQVAVPSLGVAVPFVSVGGEPLVAQLPNRYVFFLHIIASFLANEQYHRKQEIATEKNRMFAEENCSE